MFALGWGILSIIRDTKSNLYSVRMIIHFVLLAVFIFVGIKSIKKFVRWVIKEEYKERLCLSNKRMKTSTSS
jgi:large-conductance mechanosensitive channel